MLHNASSVPKKYSDQCGRSYKEGETVFITNDNKLRRLSVEHQGVLSDGQREAIRFLLNIEALRISDSTPGEEHHKSPISLDEHPTDPNNRIRLTYAHHFQVHICLAILFDSRQLRTTVDFFLKRRWRTT